MIEESPEVRTVVEQWFACDNRRDYQGMRALYSSDPSTTFIGSDPDEWWVGDKVSSVVGEARDLVDLEYFDDVRRIEAYRDGNFGWAAALSKVFIPGQEPHWWRDSFVLRREPGGWRILQSHSSIAVPNAEYVGTTLTTSLEELVAAVGQSGAGLEALTSDGSVTIAFTDLVGSTSLLSQLGDEGWAEVMEWHDRTVRRLVETNGGMVVKTLGDGAMLAFVDPVRCLTTAQAIGREVPECPFVAGLGVRVGVHTGTAVNLGSDFLGETVHIAARIAAAAATGECLVSSETQALVKDAFRFKGPSRIELRGLDGRHDVFALS